MTDWQPPLRSVRPRRLRWAVLGLFATFAFGLLFIVGMLAANLYWSQP